MIRNRSFIVTTNSAKARIIGEIENGLQQGTISSPKLFNIFNSDILNLFDLNKDNETFSSAFADDLIIGITGKNIKEMREKLNNIVNKINDYYLNWNMKINVNKCETILIKRPHNTLSVIDKKQWKEFKLEINNKTTGIKEEIPHKKTVKYLGFHIDYLFRLNDHVEIQLKKAK